MKLSVGPPSIDFAQNMTVTHEKENDVFYNFANPQPQSYPFDYCFWFISHSGTCRHSHFPDVIFPFTLSLIDHLFSHHFHFVPFSEGPSQFYLLMQRYFLAPLALHKLKSVSDLEGFLFVLIANSTLLYLPLLFSCLSWKACLLRFYTGCTFPDIIFRACMGAFSEVCTTSESSRFYPICNILKCSLVLVSSMKIWEHLKINENNSKI